MALAHLQDAKNGSDGFVHDDYNVSPFHDPAKSQFGIHANSAGSSSGLADAAPDIPPPRPSDPPGVGTAGEMRSRRRFSLRGSYNRSASEPKPPPPVMLDSDEAASEASNKSDPIYEWNVERLNALDTEVFVNIASKLMSLEWRLANVDNKLAHMHGDSSFADAQNVKRNRYNMGDLSSPERSSPGQLSPAPTSTVKYEIGTPPTDSAPPLEAVDSQQTSKVSFDVTFHSEFKVIVKYHCRCQQYDGDISTRKSISSAKNDDTNVSMFDSVPQKN